MPSDKEVVELVKQYPYDADRLELEVESVDKPIDSLIYELYGVSEIGIVEGK